MPSQIAAPIPIPPRQTKLHMITSEEVSAGLRDPSIPVRAIKEYDYTVPAPPPPSPVGSYSVDKWSSKRR